jgi:transposase-like protein
MTMVKGKRLEDDKYKYTCDNCGKEFTSSRESLFGVDLLCDECFDAYCLAEELNSWEGVEDG